MNSRASFVPSFFSDVFHVIQPTFISVGSLAVQIKWRKNEATHDVLGAVYDCVLEWAPRSTHDFHIFTPLTWGRKEIRICVHLQLPNGSMKFWSKNPLKSSLPSALAKNEDDHESGPCVSVPYARFWNLTIRLLNKTSDFFKILSPGGTKNCAP